MQKLLCNKNTLLLIFVILLLNSNIVATCQEDILVNKDNSTIPTPNYTYNYLYADPKNLKDDYIDEANLSYDKYNLPIYATDRLVPVNSSFLTTQLDKAILYNTVVAGSETLSNPLIQILINDDKAVEDNKHYADAIPRNDKLGWKTDERFIQFANIAKLEKEKRGELSPELVSSLKAIINEYYILPDTENDEQEVLKLSVPDVNFKKPGFNISDDYIKAANHIVANWKNLVRRTPQSTKSSLIPLPRPYIVPGGRFREIYYWDSYFTILGLNESGLKGLSRGMVENFMYLVKQFGFIPNGNRIYYLSRSQPPFLAMMAEEVRPDDLSSPSNRVWLEDAYRTITHEYYNNWMDPYSHYVPSIGLNRYYDAVGAKRPESWGTDNLKTSNTRDFYQHERAECESGWDFSNRFDQRSMDFIPVDLNSLLYKYEKLFEKWAKLLGKEEEAKKWADASENRKKQMNKYLWNEKEGMFFDYDMKNQVQSSYKSLATVYPLWVEMATQKQAEAVKNKVITEFEFNGGVVTSLDKTHKNLQWNYPNGWPPLQWLTISGLINYGYNEDAKRIAKKWVDLNTEYYKKLGKFVEKYNIVDENIDTTGSYPNQDGFGWTNGIYLKILSDILSK
ncbi:MAG: trehalase family glycosidase [Cyanobacteriota bacterium]